MAQEIKIRSGTQDDLPHLAGVERDAAQLYATVGYDYCVDGPVRDREECERALNDGAVFVAVSPKDEIAGFALAWRVDRAAHLLELGVSQQYQGHGFGRRLVARTEDWARQDGRREITLTTYRDVPWNAPFYNRLGYQIFEPEDFRPGLREIQADEARWGFAFKPRVAMRKDLRNPGPSQ